MTCKVTYRRKDDGSRNAFRYRFEADSKEALELLILGELQLLQRTYPTMIVHEKKYTA